MLLLPFFRSKQQQQKIVFPIMLKKSFLHPSKKRKNSSLLSTKKSASSFLIFRCNKSLWSKKRRSGKIQTEYSTRLIHTMIKNALLIVTSIESQPTIVTSIKSQTTRKNLREEKLTFENQQENVINQIMINFFRLVEYLLGKYVTECFLDDPRFRRWETVYFRYKRYLYFKMVKDRKWKSWIEQQLQSFS